MDKTDEMAVGGTGHEKQEGKVIALTGRDGKQILYDELPYIKTVFDSEFTKPVNRYYLGIVCKTLKEILPSNYFRSRLMSGIDSEEVLSDFHSRLPMFSYSEFRKPPFNLCFYLLSRFRSNAFQFFIQMISRWLVPGQRLNVQLLYAVDFQMPGFSDQIYTLSTVMINVQSKQELAVIQKNLPTLESEICLGAESYYYAQRILDIRGLSADEKTAMIQEHIAYLVDRLPEAFGPDVFSEMQHVLVTCRDEFKELREYRHLSRIISLQYLFRKAIREALEQAPKKRHLSLKLFKGVLHEDAGTRHVLGVAVGVNFLRDNEVFGEPHMLKAIQTYLPEVRAVEGSFYSRTGRTDRICTLYLEIEREDGQEFSQEEINTLRQELPADLKDRVEHLMHPVFMPVNEEETMRAILALSNQIKFVRDLPQVVISFKEQTDHDVVFNVIMVRVCKGETAPVEELFQKKSSSLSFYPDRVKTVGFLRKRYPKEANVFEVSMRKNHFLRADHSLDLQRARQKVVTELVGVIGEFRDYNGGMIAKQEELFSSMKALLADRAKGYDFLLENFFYSVSPIVMRSVLEPQVLKTLFLLLLDVVKEGSSADTPSEQSGYAIHETPEALYVALCFSSSSTRDQIVDAVEPLNVGLNDIAYSCVDAYGVHGLGFVYLDDAPEARAKLVDTIEAKLEPVASRV